MSILATSLYRHYRGGLYLVIGTAETHNHNGDVDVVYASLTHGKLVTRPLQRDSRDEDAWLDDVTWPDGEKRGRFMIETSRLAALFGLVEGEPQRKNLT